MNWFYLCKKCFSGRWKLYEVDRGGKCDICGNRSFFAVYDVKFKSYPLFLVRLCNLLDFRFWRCKCGYYGFGRCIDSACRKHFKFKWD